MHEAVRYEANQSQDKTWMQQWYHAMSLLKHTGTKMVVKKWMDEEAERERERNLCQAMMIAVTLNR